MDVVLAFSYVSYVYCLIAFFFIWFTVFVVCTVIYHFNSNLVASCVLAHRALIHLNFDTYNEVSANGAIYIPMTSEFPSGHNVVKKKVLHT